MWIPTLDFGLAFALLVITGIVIGSVIYDVYNFLYWWSAWNCPVLGSLWGLDHITTLRVMLNGKDDRHLKAVWDAVFFRNRDEVQIRILNMFSAAHGSATAGIAILLSMLTWLCYFVSKGIPVPHIGIWLLVLTVPTLLALNHRRLCRDAGALENLFLKEGVNSYEVQMASKVLDSNPP